MDKKRLLAAGIFLIIVILLGYTLYRVFFAPKVPTGTTTGGTRATSTAGTFPQVGQGSADGRATPPGAGLPDSGGRVVPGQTDGSRQTPGLNADGTQPRVSKAVDSRVVNAATSPQGGVQFYNSQDGKFYRLGPDGQPVALSDEVFYNVNKVTWSPKQEESIIEYPDGSNIYYNFDTKKQVTLPKHWDEFSFSPDGGKIAAKSLSLAPENRWLLTSAPDGSSIKLVEPMGENADKVMVDWSPNQQVVALSRTGDPLGADRQEVLLVGLNKENYRSLTVEGRGLETQWSPTGNKLLHSVYNTANDFKPQLWIANGSPDTVGENRRLLDVSTWASKCAVADDRFVYCGVPTRLDTGAGFAPDLAKQTPDRLIKIDTATGIKTEIPLQNNYTIDSITLDPNGKDLYFTDKNQSGLFKVNL